MSHSKHSYNTSYISLRDRLMNIKNVIQLIQFICPFQQFNIKRVINPPNTLYS